MFPDTLEWCSKAAASLLHELNVNGSLWKRGIEAKCLAYHNQSLETCNNDRNSWKLKYIGDIFALILEVSQRGALPTCGTQTTSLSCSTDSKLANWHRSGFSSVTCQENPLHPKRVVFIVEHPFSPLTTTAQPFSLQVSVTAGRYWILGNGKSSKLKYFMSCVNCCLDKSTNIYISGTLD